MNARWRWRTLVVLVPALSPRPPLCCTPSAHSAASPATSRKKDRLKGEKAKRPAWTIGYRVESCLCPHTVPSFLISCCFLGLTCFLNTCRSMELWLWLSWNSSGLRAPGSCWGSLGKASLWAVVRKASSDRGQTEAYLKQQSTPRLKTTAIVFPFACSRFYLF